MRTSNIEHRTSNAQRRTEEAKVTVRPAHLSLLVLFGSTLDVRRSMFDVRVSSLNRITSAQSSLPIQNQELPPAMPVWAAPVSSKLANALSAFKIQNFPHPPFFLASGAATANKEPLVERWLDRRAPPSANPKSKIRFSHLQENAARRTSKTSRRKNECERRTSNTSRRKNEYEHRTSNVEHPTSNRRGENNSLNGPSFSLGSLRFGVRCSAFDVRCSMFDVRLFSLNRITSAQSPLPIASGHASQGCAGFLQAR